MDKSLNIVIHCIDHKIIKIDINYSLFYLLKICVNGNKIENNCLYSLMENNCCTNQDNKMLLRLTHKSYQSIYDHKNENINNKDEITNDKNVNNKIENDKNENDKIEKNEKNNTFNILKIHKNVEIKIKIEKLKHIFKKYMQKLFAKIITCLTILFVLINLFIGHLKQYIIIVYYN